MKDCLITFRSVTPAQRGEILLRRSRLDCALQRTPRWMEEQGCGYSLVLDFGQVAKAVSLLRQAGISWRKVYRRSGDGRWEELEP